MFLDVVRVVGGLTALYFGGNWLVRGASRLATSFGVSSLVVGMTVVAFGTSAPELLVAIGAVFHGAPGIALGNVIGSNIANIGLILGVTGMMLPIAVYWQLIRIEIPLMIAITLLTYALVLDGMLGFLDGIILLIALVVFNTFVMMRAAHDRKEIQTELKQFGEAENLTTPITNRLFEFAVLVGGIATLAIGAKLTVGGAAHIASHLGVSDVVIGLTLVAFGTSLPELAASVSAALRNESDIAVGNVIGSNITNLLLILGVTSSLRPIPVAQGTIRFEFPVMIAFSVLLLPFSSNRILGRAEASVFLMAYVIFMAILFVV